MGGGGKSQNQTTNQTEASTTTSPGTPYGVAALPGYEQAFNDAQAMGPWTGGTIANAGANNWTGPVAYTGDHFAPDSNWTGPTNASGSAGEQAGYQGMVDYGASLTPRAQGIVDSGLTTAQQMADGSFWTDRTPALLQDALEGFNRSSMMLAPSASSQGAYGGSGWGRAANWMQDDFQENWNNTLAQLDSDRTAQQLGAMSQLPAFLSGLTAFGNQGNLLQVAGGQGLRGLEDIDLTNLINSFNATKANEQVGIDNAMANFDATTKNDMSAFLGNQANAQSLLDNERDIFNQIRLDPLNMFTQYFQGLQLIPGQASTGTLQSNTTGSSSGGGLGDIMGLLGALGNGADLFRPSSGDPGNR